FNQFGRDKNCVTSTVLSFFEHAGCLVLPRLHHRRMASAEQFQKPAKVSRQNFQMRQIGHNPESSQYIMRVGGALLRNDPVKDNFGGFLDGKLGAFDEV